MKISKILALILSLVMTVTIFAGCGGDANTVVDPENGGSVAKTPEAQVEEIAEGYLEAASALDIKGGLKYIDKNSDLYAENEEAGDVDLDAMVDTVIAELDTAEEEMGVPGFFDECEPAIRDFFDELMNMIEYEIGEVTVDGDKATVAYVIKTPDFNNIDMEAYMASAMSEDALAAVAEKIAGMSEDEAMDYLKEYMGDLFEKALDDALDELEKTTLETNGTLDLENIDGEWLITADE